MAKTASPFLRFIRFTEPVVMIVVTGQAAVLMTISETTLSETICSIVPGKRFRMLVLMTLWGYLTSATLRQAQASLRLFELARVLVRLDHIARVIVPVYMILLLPCGERKRQNPPREVLGDHRRPSQETRLELGLRFSGGS
jgi:hypothetical protein